MVELKVDDHEHLARGTKEYQTKVYPTLFPTCKNGFFVTLGSGEYYSEPKGSEFRWDLARQMARQIAVLLPLARALAGFLRPDADA